MRNSYSSNMNAQFDLNNPHIPIEEGIISMLGEIDDAVDNETIEEADMCKL